MKTKAVVPLEGWRRELCEQWQHLPRCWARRWSSGDGRHHLFRELHSAAMLGLVNAAIAYEPERGWTFTTYASAVIKKHMMRMERTTIPVRIPPSVVCDVSRMHHGESPIKGTTAKTLKQADRVMNAHCVPVDAYDPPERSACRMSEEQRDIVRESLRLLDHRRRFIIALHYGIHCTPTFTLDEIGKMLGITRERVRQIEARSFITLEKHLRPIRKDLANVY